MRAPGSLVGTESVLRSGRCLATAWAGTYFPSAALLFLFLAAGCGGAPAPERPLPPGVRAAEVAHRMEALTRPPSPRIIRFRFRVREADFRFQGEGAARIDPAYRVRLDLFSSQGETLFQAALDGSELRVPPWAPRELAPPPALLWAALGVFRPDAGLDFLGGTGAGKEGVVLRYGDPAAVELRFRIREGRLRRAELYREGHLSEEVDLTPGEELEGVVETVYRNRGEFLEMTFSLESIENVEAFPPHIWYPGR